MKQVHRTTEQIERITAEVTEMNSRAETRKVCLVCMIKGVRRFSFPVDIKYMDNYTNHINLHK